MRLPTGVLAVLCALALTGCQLYWTRPGATLATFSADHGVCTQKAGVPMEGDRLLVNESLYKACLKALGWTRETGSTHGNPAGYYRGLEEDTVVRVGEVPKQVGETEAAAAGTVSAPPSRVQMCRQTYLMMTDWRDRLPQYYACLEGR